ncbi:iron-containing redox enzyme family protein [Pseudomonas sp. Marseille-QA0332]
MNVMTRTVTKPLAPATASTTAGAPDSCKARYQALLAGEPVDSANWLAELLERTRSMADDLPDDPQALDQWTADHAAKVAGEYAVYLQARQQGAPRRYFANRSQALFFLQQVAPTKVVDGAWLHSTLSHWQDPRYHGLIRTYLEELGDGDPRSNHVLIYQRLLSRLGCLEPVPMDDARYLQGAVQLALGMHGDAFLPEVIGYNLGYEQPPLHLLITTYELAELGIDGFYFQLHVTIDNAASGHARKSIEALHQLCPAEDAARFYERVRQGYRLNDLGIDTPSLIASFDLQQELVDALERKRVFGQFMHADHCRLQGRTINQWLAPGEDMASFLEALQAQRWVRRAADPLESRFFRLMEGPTAPMFGVFSPYERQLWHDWIAADWQGPAPRRVMPGSWEAALQIDEQGSRARSRLSTAELTEQMAGNRHALPAGLLATRAYIRQTGLAEGRPC